MPTNENLSAVLVTNLIAAGYTPKTPEEWIMSAIDYLHDSSSSPDGGLASVLGISNDANNGAIINLASISSSANLDLTGVVADILFPDWTFDKGVGLIPLVDATVSLGSATFNLSQVNTTGVLSNTALLIRTSNNGNVNVVISGSGAFNVSGLDDYATNAAALAGGLVAGDLFYTNTAGEATVKIVV